MRIHADPDPDTDTDPDPKPCPKVLTYLEYRAVSGVFPSSPRTKGRGVHTRRAVRGLGVNISEDARHWIGLFQYNPSTVDTLQRKPGAEWSVPGLAAGRAGGPEHPPPPAAQAHHPAPAPARSADQSGTAESGEQQL
jgi:hypothetical protein